MKCSHPDCTGVHDNTQALLRSSPEGATEYVQADLRDTELILERAADLLDFGQPVAVMLIAVLHLIQDDEDPWGIVARLMDAVPPGSYLAISHPALDVHHAQSTIQKVYDENVSTPQTLRTRDEVARFFYRAGPGGAGTGAGPPVAARPE